MQFPMFQVDAFTDRVFGGNPAAVVLLPMPLPEETLQAIAAENNLSETAFVVPASEGFDLRWFTPRLEIDLCGHATLASAHVLFAGGHASGPRVVFHSRSGDLVVERDGNLLALDFPSRPPAPAPDDPRVSVALGGVPAEILRARDLLAIFASEDEVKGLRPDFARVEQLDAFAVIVSAPGSDCDFVSRFFAPRAGIAEDPVTGSAHCTLIPYWSRRLGKPVLHARQVSERGGVLFCEDRGERVRIAGRCAEYLRGQITI
jgi:predicted PhzF superfamily epimerase YddE/YHI9